MGNDGGSIPKRVDLVKQKKKEVKKDYIAINKLRSKHCAISNQKLKKPIVACRMGYLYSKEVVYGCLIKKDIPKAFRHIKKTKDVKDVTVIENQKLEYPLICPLTREVHNGINKFVLIWKCGCMISQKAFDACKGSHVCPHCSTKFKDGDVISLWDSLESIEMKKKLMFKFREERKRRKAAKKAGKGADGLGKRNPLDELPEFKRAKKKKVEPENILDGIVKKGFDKELYKSMFHKQHDVEDANGLLFRNVRFGIR